MLQGASREAANAAIERLESVLGDLPDAAAAWRLSEELAEVTRLLDDELPLRRTLADPSIDGRAKAQLAEGLLGSRVLLATLELVKVAVAARWSHQIDLVDTVESMSASAGFASAERAGVLDEVEDELFRITRVFERETDLYTALSSQSLPAERKAEVINAVLGQAQQVTRAMVLRAATTRRTRTLDRALTEYLRLAAARRARLVATVTSGTQLDPQQTDQLREALQRLYRHDLQLQTEIDPALVGGVVVRIGDEVIDGTIAHRFAQARRRLAG
ncbi:MAG: F0F1 ATP synthase subunit delta [Frankiaceae bacterium]